ncbi:MAG: PAS domain S-box protein [Deltaproteobacteria bacterium]
MIREGTLQEYKKRIRSLEAALRKQKKLNETLLETQNIHKTIVDKSQVGYYISLDGKFAVMNPVAISYTGYSPDRILGRKSDSLIHPEDKARTRANARAMLLGKLTDPYEFRIITKDKEIRWVMEVVAPIVLEGKRAILGNTTDVTKFKLTEQLYRTIFETTGTATVIIENDKTIFLVNSEFEKLVGYPREELEGKHKWTEFVEKQDLARLEGYHSMRRIDPDAAPRSFEYDVIDSRGRVRSVLGITCIIPGTKKHVSSIIDITDLKEKELELTLKSRNLEELNAALKVLLKQREQDREEIEKTMMTNMRDLVLPYFEKIRKGGVDKKLVSYLDLLEGNLENIISPFSRKLSSKYMQLTSKEIQVANLIKDGKGSKDIAQMLNVSNKTIDMYRYRIRLKLGLSNHRINLCSYLGNLP